MVVGRQGEPVSSGRTQTRQEEIWVAGRRSEEEQVHDAAVTLEGVRIRGSGPGPRLVGGWGSTLTSVSNPHPPRGAKAN